MITFASPALAQQAPIRLEMQEPVQVVRGGWDAIRVVKWSAAITSAGVVAYGFVQNREADREYEEIERLCQEDAAACATLPDASEYADPALEARYNAVVERDERAQLALLLGQVGLAASVLLFILDLPEGSGTNDIPYDPRALRLGFVADRLHAGLRIPTR